MTREPVVDEALRQQAGNGHVNPRLAWLVAAGLGCFAASVEATESPFSGGESGGSCGSALEQGLDLQLVYTGEQAWVRGGKDNGSTYLDNVDLTVAVDLDKLLGQRGAEVFVYVLGNQGGSPTKFAGDWQVVSNIDAPDTWKLYELWYQRRWSEDRYSLKAGLYDLNTEFDAMDTAGLFLNSAFGIGSDISQTGVNGPSIFPTTSLALRGRAELGAQLYAQAAMLDGVPGDPERPHGTRIELDRDDGLLAVGEVGYLHEPAAPQEGSYRKFALGAWRYTAAVTEDAFGSPLRHEENSGIYVLAEGALLVEPEDPSQGLSAFLRYGVADQRINRIDAFMSGGMVYSGLLPGREGDRAGIAFAHARNSERYRQASAAAGAPMDSHETVVELSYRAPVRGWLTLQCDYQYVINPGTDPQLGDAQVYSLRFEIAL